MSAPGLELEVNFSQQDAVYYLPLGASSRTSVAQFKLCVRLRIRHADPVHDELTLSGITFSFPGSNTAPMSMEFFPDGNLEPVDPKLLRGQSRSWFNGNVFEGSGDDRIERGRHQIYRDMPAPQLLDIAIQCEETEHAFVKRYRLLPWTRDPLLLPFTIEDLDDDEYVGMRAYHYFNGGNSGTQMFAHDISIQGRVNGKLSGARVANPTKNEDIRIFGRPVRGMADGVVKTVKLGERRKTGIGGGIEIVERRGGGVGRDEPPEYQAAFIFYKDNPLGAKRTDEHYGSIYVVVDYGGIIVKYHHLKAGSVSVEEGDTIWPGRKIGEAGNTGNTSTPHLHIECVTPTDGLCGMAFKNAWMLDHDLADAYLDGDRVHLDGAGVCFKPAALRPFGTDFRPQRERPDRVEQEALEAEVFGGVAQGGDGFIIVNGKLRRVPPRGIRGELLAALIEYERIADLPVRQQAALKDKLAQQIAGLAKGMQR